MAASFSTGLLRLTSSYFILTQKDKRREKKELKREENKKKKRKELKERTGIKLP